MFRYAWQFFQSAAVVALGVATGGCAPASDPIDGAAIDRSTEELKVPGMTVWLGEGLELVAQGGPPTWVLRGKTSKNLTFASAFSDEHELGTTVIVSPRKFEVTLGADDLARVATGERLYVRLDVATGAKPTFHVALRLAPTLLEGSGSAKVHLDEAVDAFVVDDEVVYRAGVIAPKSTKSVSAKVVTATFPGVAVAPGHYAVDLSFGAVAQLASSASAKFKAKTALATSERAGSIAIEVVDAGLTDAEPLVAFPPEVCAPAVLSCLASAGADTSGCGIAREVLPCAAEDGIPAGVTADRFATDLADAVTAWYALHGGDVAAAGGNSLPEALDAIDVSLVTLVDDAEEDPHAHDLSSFVVFRHPDVAFPGSDIVWFGAYDKETGALEGVYDFN